MKKIMASVNMVLFAGFLLCSLQGSAQTEKGHISVSGASTLNFLSNTNKFKSGGEYVGKNSSNALNFQLAADYYVIDNVFVGIESWIETNKNTTKDANGNTLDESKTVNFSIGPRVGYYFPLSGPLRPYALVAVNFSTEGAEDDKDKYTGIRYGGGLGVSYFLVKMVTLDLQLSYSRGNFTNKADKDYKYTNNQFYPALGVTVFF